MLRGLRLTMLAAIVAAATLVIHADAKPPSESADIQLQLGRVLFEQGRYLDSLEAYQRALDVAPDTSRARLARIGVIQCSLRAAKFDRARREADALLASEPHSAEAMALYGDSLWAAGLFPESETEYRNALALQPELARGHHGLARALAARSRLDEAMNEAQAALRLSPRDLEIHHTVGSIYERMHKYDEAAAEYADFVDLLPNKDQSDQAAWARAEIRFLRSFGGKVPFQMDPSSAGMLHTINFKLEHDKVVVRAKINGASAQDFVLDTGAENTVVSRETAAKRGITPVTYTLSAGVGEVGLRGLQLARMDSLEIGTLKLYNVPCLIKNPPLKEIPTKETESFSPLALGLSMTVDYKKRTLTIGPHLPPEPADFELPLWLYRLATVRGVVDGARTANFVVDTGGEVISISQATASALGGAKHLGGRRIPLKVYGTSGWDRDAFLLPGVDLAFNEIHYRNFPVVVLNLEAPSVLLGFQVGGIVGHQFLRSYRVGIDLDRSMLRLRRES
ncbi:MAG: retroviral-like aspartic protease family protein [Betaproteobacteria bacterium]